MTRFAFAGDRQIAVNCLRFLTEQGAHPELLMIPSPERASHADELVALSGLDPSLVLTGRAFREQQGIDLLASLDLDYIIGIHFPYIVPESVLDLPRIGVVNLHPALLPYNRGWHTASWSILDETPIGATLHFMDAGLDTGDIVIQAGLEVGPDDTAHTLVSRLHDLELAVFEEGWPLLAGGSPPRLPQRPGEGTGHSRADLGDDSIRRLDLDSTLPVGEVISRLRALTTNDLAEAAYFEVDGRRYRLQVSITPDDDTV
jgi:methionyl-tRNA formyltransferase